MKYKVGDVVCIRSMSDIGKIIDSKGCVGGIPFKVSMNKYCSSRMTIDQIHDIDGYYRMREDPWHFYNDEMIERLVEEEVGLVDNLSSRWVNEFNLPEGYQFKDENGNVINTQKIVLEKKKKEYPKTYEECAEIIAELTGSDCNPKGCMGYMSVQLTALQKLLICRDAYWKIAGEEMGLGKPWKPDWCNEKIKYCLVDIPIYGGICKRQYEDIKQVLAFPTEEMRDAFKESEEISKLIDKCKELL